MSCSVKNKMMARRSFMTDGTKLNIITPAKHLVGWGVDRLFGKENLHPKKPEYIKRAFRKKLKIVYALFKLMKQKLLEGHMLEIPNVGRFFISQTSKVKVSGSSSNIHWPKTKKLWKEKPELKNKQFVYILNEHSDGVVYSIRWSRANMKLKYTTYYTFIASSILRREMADLIRNGKEYSSR